MAITLISLLTLALAQTALEARAKRNAARHSVRWVFHEPRADGRSASSPFDRSTTPENRIQVRFRSDFGGLPCA